MNIFSDLIDLKGRFPLCISDPQDTLPGSVVIWKPSTPDGHLPISQDAPITTHLALGSNDHIPMPLCWYEQCQILRATLVDAMNLMGLFRFFISFWLFTTLLLQQARQLYPPLFCSQFSSKVLQNRKSLLARQPVGYSSNLIRHSKVSRRSC